GERADAASDVFALGAVFYEVLTGRRAFSGESLHSILGKVLTDDPPAPREVAPEVPDNVQAIVHRALTKDRRERFQNAGEMRAALRAAEPSLAPGRRRAAGKEPGPGIAVGTGGQAAARAPAAMPAADLP